MFKKTESTRLGEVLISKGLITPEQLTLATQEQSNRKRLYSSANQPHPKATLIGEILVELGFIDELELKRGLNWQQRLRHVSIAMALCAPFMAFAPASASTSISSSSISSTFKPVTIQAENYTTMSGVWNEPTSDLDGGQDTGNIDTGDWMSYSNTEINIPATGTYKITFRVASVQGGGTLAFKEADTEATLDTIAIPATGGWQTWVDIVRTVTLAKGSHRFKLYAITGGFNVNWFTVESALPEASSSSSIASSSAPTNTVNENTALTIQAEDYTTMSGVWNEPTNDTGGGRDTGNIDTGDWMSYTNTKVSIPATGKYKITLRVASLNTAGSLAFKEADTDTTLDTIPIPVTGGWQTWVDVVRTVNLTQGTHSFKMFAVSGGFNVNWFNIEAIPTEMPLTIQAENYSAMSGVWNEFTPDIGGGQDTGNIDTGDWMTYYNVDVLIPITATYKMTYRLASPYSGTQFTLSEAGSTTLFDTVTVPQTGGWQNWVSLERTITLPAGKHNFAIQALVGGFNINWFTLEPVTASASSPSSASTAASSTSSSSSSAPATITNSSSSTGNAGGNGSTITGANHVAGPVVLSWAAPLQRENGRTLDITELGGYEIRYRQDKADNYIYITINDAWTDRYNFTWLEGDYIFQIAAFDKEGLYSNFTDILPR